MNRRFLLTALPASLAVPRRAAADPPCCGPVTLAGQKLAETLDGMDVADRWLAHQHVDWETGLPDRAADSPGPSRSTHCSAFAAAAGLRLGVYMLRPPEHSQMLLASAQTQWFATQAAAASGWRPVADWQAAQTLANEGQLVVIAYANPDMHHPGHIVIVRPSTNSAAALAVEGPQVIQAATRNKPSYPAAQSFRAHPGAWPDQVRIFAHAVPG